MVARGGSSAALAGLRNVRNSTQGRKWIVEKFFISFSPTLPSAVLYQSISKLAFLFGELA
jgi:hypothetical protein